MVRASVALSVHAVTAQETDLYSPPELPPDIRVLKRNYPLRTAQEAGEKAFSLDESYSLPSSMGNPEQLIRCELRPELTDWKLMGDKVVFRGAALLHVLYRCAEGQLHTWDQEIPFSQYAELEGEYNDEDIARVVPILTNLDTDLDPEGKLHIKAGLSGQYTVYGCQMAKIVEDAYSPNRTVEVQKEPLQLPVLLDTQNSLLRVEQAMDADVSQLVDLAFWPDSPLQMRTDAAVQTQLPGTFQLLYRDQSGQLQSTNAYWEETVQTEAAPNTWAHMTAMPSGIPQMQPSAGGVAMSADIMTDADFLAQQQIPMVTALTVGEQTRPDPNRPSLVLRKPGTDSLWDIAKATGSTVEDIMTANGITDEPDPQTIILIPIS